MSQSSSSLSLDIYQSNKSNSEYTFVDGSKTHGVNSAFKITINPIMDREQPTMQLAHILKHKDTLTCLTHHDEDQHHHDKPTYLFNKILLPDHPCEAEKEMHDILDVFDLNQINIKETIQARQNCKSPELKRAIRQQRDSILSIQSKN